MLQELSLSDCRQWLSSDMRGADAADVGPPLGCERGAWYRRLLTLFLLWATLMVIGLCGPGTGDPGTSAARRGSRNR